MIKNPHQIRKQPPAGHKLLEMWERTAGEKKETK